VKHGIFLTHGEEESRTAFKAALVAAGCDAAKIFTPQLDDRVDLLAQHVELPKARRLPPEKVGRPDWHNTYSALTLDLRRRLDALGDDAARESLLAQLRAILESAPPSS
jgi:metallo-beta-lactamase family protein